MQAYGMVFFSWALFASNSLSIIVVYDVAKSYNRQEQIIRRTNGLLMRSMELLKGAGTEGRY